MADGHPRALAGSAEASVAVAEIRDATRKLILNNFKALKKKTTFSNDLDSIGS